MGTSHKWEQRGPEKKLALQNSGRQFPGAKPGPFDETEVAGIQLTHTDRNWAVRFVTVLQPQRSREGSHSTQMALVLRQKYS